MKNSNELVEFEIGEEILHEGNYGNSLYIIKEGQVEVFETNSDGDKFPLAIVNSNEFLGEMGVLTSMPVSATAVALTNVKAFKIRKDIIEDQIKTVPPWLISLAKGALHRIHMMNEIIRRNNIVDDRLKSAIEAVESKYQSRENMEQGEVTQNEVVGSPEKKTSDSKKD